MLPTVTLYKAEVIPEKVYEGLQPISYYNKECQGKKNQESRVDTPM